MIKRKFLVASTSTIWTGIVIDIFNLKQQKQKVTDNLYNTESKRNLWNQNPICNRYTLKQRGGI